MSNREDSAVAESARRSAMEDSKYYARQICSALVPILSTIVTGMTIGYSAVLLPQLKVSPNILDSQDRVTNSTLMAESVVTVRTIDEESWIAASAVLAMVPGCWMSSLLMDKLGRKTSFLVINPIALVGWVTIALANSLVCLIAGRFICGLCVGVLGGTSSVYIAETSHPRLRGLLLAALSLAMAIGVLSVHALGTWLDWRITAYITAIIPLISLVLGLFAPESPNWLLYRGRREEALASWTLLRGDHSIEEFQDLKATHDISVTRDGTDSTRQPTGSKCSLSSTWSLVWRTRLSSRIFLMPLLIVCVYSLTSQSSGINIVTFYCVQMIQEVSGHQHAYAGTLFLDLTRVLFSALACWLTRQYPRRALTIVSGLATCVILLSLSASLFADFGRPWLPIVLLFFFTGTVSIGLVPLPWLLCAELFNDKNRALGSGLTAGFAFFCFFVVVKTGPLAFGVLSPAGTFAVYGTVVLLGSVFLYFYLPETKNKSLRDIEKNFIAKICPATNSDKFTMKIDPSSGHV